MGFLGSVHSCTLCHFLRLSFVTVVSNPKLCSSYLLLLFCLPKKVGKKRQKIPKLRRSRPTLGPRDFYPNAPTQPTTIGVDKSDFVAPIGNRSSILRMLTRTRLLWQSVKHEPACYQESQVHSNRGRLSRCVSLFAQWSWPDTCIKYFLTITYISRLSPESI
jgi:hypothetical protein